MSDDFGLDEYFSMEELKKMSLYEKLRHKNALEKYNQMKTLKLQPVIPNFLMRKQKRIVATETKNTGNAKRTRDSVDDDEWVPEKPSKKAVRCTSKLKEKSERKRQRNDENGSSKSDNEATGTRSFSEPGSGNRYPKRVINKPNYKEIDIPDIDTSIYCDDCEREWEGDCEMHPLNIIEDTPVPIDKSDEDRARKTKPGLLAVDSSKIPGAGNGVWARKLIPYRTRFGPYEGKIVPVDVSTGYGWQIRKDGKPDHCIDASEPGLSNWMRYVNCARHKEEQNVFAFQYCGKLYYRTTRQIAPLEELLVWYGDEYGAELGIQREDFHSENKGNLKQLIFRCPTCDNSFSSPVYLERHQCHQKRDRLKEIDIEVRRNAPKEKRFACTFCDSRFTASHSLKTHERTHTGEKPFICRYCNLRFTDRSTLKRHERTHTGEKPFICTTCNKRFTANHHLKHHERIHTGEKPFICTTCNKRFTASHHLKHHERIHTGEKPFICTTCNKRFTASHHLKHHERIHTGEKPFICTTCNKRFSRNYLLKGHERIHSSALEC